MKISPLLMETVEKNETGTPPRGRVLEAGKKENQVARGRGLRKKKSVRIQGRAKGKKLSNQKKRGSP